MEMQKTLNTKLKIVLTEGIILRCGFALGLGLLVYCFVSFCMQFSPSCNMLNVMTLPEFDLSTETVWFVLTMSSSIKGLKHAIWGYEGCNMS